jgi:hypothetical protein
MKKTSTGTVKNKKLETTLRTKKNMKELEQKMEK